ncbi:hypothetical protein AGR56_04230 [Clostridium sp. DMHC 10]|uniref:hypothetical protein n=1 Tax=Clostridium sp. DMHC 10 TaxID=747377 RepID=UPI00069DF861|nr:hypothetical protein [Clostridium sp. DMHC 10]KOF56133.1 hypothetical protein AGR56_04230 [Clostridium sp. DMHC 10]
MIKLQEIYKLCNGLEVKDRRTGIKELIYKGCSKSTASIYYNIWRRHYLESTKNDLQLSGIFIRQGKKRKRLEECSYKERQKYLQALSKEQLIKIVQVVFK